MFKKNQKILFLSVGLFFVAGLLILTSCTKKTPVVDNNNNTTTNTTTNTQNQNNGNGDQELVWYEIPELGIKFKVTPDTKSDLSYNFNGYSEVSSQKLIKSQFYSELEYKNNGCNMGNLETKCNTFNIFGTVESNSRYNCKNNNMFILLKSEDNVVCVADEEIYSDNKKILSSEDYKNFFGLEKIGQNKQLDIYFDTVETIDDYANYCPSNYGYSKGKCVLLEEDSIQDKRDYLFFGYGLYGEDLGFGYKIYKDQVYHWNPNPHSVPTMTLLDADPNTFQVIDGKMDGSFVVNAYGKDDKKVFLVEDEIEGANPETFQLLKSNNKITPYSKDKDSIFYETRKLEEADYNSFEVGMSKEGRYIAKDKNNCYRGKRVVDGELCSGM